MSSLPALNSLDAPVDALGGEELRPADAEQGEELFEQVDDKFVVVSINVEYVADLAWHNERASSDREVYVKFLLDPGNVHVSTDPFAYSEKCSKPVEMVLPVSLTTESAGAMIEIEVWEVRRGAVQQEFMGQCRRFVHELLRDSRSQEIRFTRRRRKTSCGKMGLLMKLNSNSGELSTQLFSEMRESRLLEDKADCRKKAHIAVMVLESQSLPQHFSPAIVASIDEAKPLLRTDTASYDDKRNAFVWNYRLCFEISQENLIDGKISFTMIHENEDVNSNSQQVLGSATIMCSSLKLDGSTFCGWLTLSAAEQQWNARVRVAGCLLIDNTQVEYVQDQIADCEATESPAMKYGVNALEQPGFIPLGSLLEVKLEFICATSASDAEYLSECIGTGNEEGRLLNIRGRIHLLGGISQRATTRASVSPDTTHCKKQTCLRLQSENRDPTVLRFELSPDVVTNSLPQLSLDFRPKRSQEGSLSLTIALSCLLKELLSQVEYQCSIPLVDQKGGVRGRLSTCFRAGLQSDQQILPCAAVVHRPQACILTVKVVSLQAFKEDNKGIRCVANIWTSRTDKSQAQTISPLTWGSGGEISESNCVSLNVSDTTTDILFVGIYRFSNHERNELIGLGTFSICSHPLPADNQRFELSVRLYGESKGKDGECGSVVFGLQTARVPSETDSARNVSLAATELGSVAYPIQSGEMKCRFDMDILAVHGLPPTVLEGDNIFIQLRIAQTNWKNKLGPTKVTLSADGNNVMAPVHDKTHTIVCWSSKDRSFPVLEVLVYAQPQRVQNRTGIASKVSLATTSHLKRRQDRKGSKSTQRANEVVTPVLVAAGSLNLCSFYSQLNVSARVDLSLTVEKTDTDIDNCDNPITMLSTLRASSFQENDACAPTLPDVNVRQWQVVKGDLCIHLLQGAGSILRKANSVSSYYVLISCGPEEVASGCCSADEGTLTWNQHLVLRIATTGPPTVHLTLYHRSVELGGGKSDSSQPSQGDQIVGYLTLPMFPSVLDDEHLLQLEIPFGMPFGSEEVDSAKNSNDPYYYKRGMLTLEMQFLSSEHPKTKPSTMTEVFELVIHRVRGNLQDMSSTQRPPGVVKHIFVDISLMSDRGGIAEELAVGATGVISISASGITEVGEVVDLSNPIIAATLLNGPSNVLVGRIRDLSGNYYGRVHLPLRKDWKQRLVDREKKVWYPICIESSGGVTATKDALLMSLQVREQNIDTTTQAKSLGKFHVSVCEAILTPGCQSVNMLKLSKYDGANVQLTYSPTANRNNEIRYRTRQSTNQNNSQHWRWEDEWFAFYQKDKQNATQELQVSLQVGAQSNQPPLAGNIDLYPVISDAKFRRVDLWIPLDDQLGSHRATMSAHVHIAVIYIPTVVGTINLDFGESFTFSESERRLHVETIFYKCVLQGASYITAADDRDVRENNAASYKRLRLPYDTSLDTSTEVPRFVIQWMGATKTLGEVCLGVFSIDLLSISELCCLTSEASSPDGGNDRFIWCDFYDKADRTKITGVAKFRVVFEPARNIVLDQRANTVKTLENRVASAETFTIWKKLFYLLDQNCNGYIDRNEFTNVFLDHVEDMTKTSDGQKLLQLLFGYDGNQANTIQGNANTPTQEQIAALFSIMDTNRDNEIEWSEYLRFLQRKQQQFVNSTNESGENPAHEPTEVTSGQKQELRKKRREDQRALPPTFEERTIAASNQTPEELRAADPKDGALKQGRAAPKRSSKVSSAEHKLLKLQYSNQEQCRLQEQVASLEAILAIERRRFAELAADRQALMRSYQQLHLKHQNELIQEQTKSKWMKQTIERQQQQLEEREMARKNRTQASIVLQSTVRTRLEQKRYQGLKLQRANAAIAIQCMMRRVKAKGILQVLQELDRANKRRIRAASRLQKFIRFHLHRKERALLVEARNLSSTILQKNTRRMIASKIWQRQKLSIVKLQCWIRQRQAIQLATRIRDARLVVKTFVLGWFARWKYTKMKENIRKLQRWWSRSSKERSAYLELLEAVLCVQSAWKRRSARKWFKREWQRQETYISQLEAAICIQAAWRGQHQRLLSFRSRESTPRYEDDSVVEALLYDIVAIIEADAVPSESNIPSLMDTSAGDQSEAHSETTSADEANATTLTIIPGGHFTLSHPPSPNGISRSDENEILALMMDLFEVVVSAGEHDEFCSEGTGLPVSSSDFTPVEANSTYNLVDHCNPRSILDTGHAPVSKANLDELEENTTPVYTENEDDSSTISFAPETREEELNVSDYFTFTIVENVLEGIKDLLISQEANGDIFQTDRISSKLNKIAQSDQGSCQDEPLAIKTRESHHDPIARVNSTDNVLKVPRSRNEDQPNCSKDNNAPQKAPRSSPDIVTTTTTDASNPAKARADKQIDSSRNPVEILQGVTDLGSEASIAPSQHTDPEDDSGSQQAPEHQQEVNTTRNDDGDQDVNSGGEAVSESQTDTPEKQDITTLNTIASNLGSDATGKLDAAFDTDLAAIGDFAMPEDSDSDQLGLQNDESDGESPGGSSIDSTDLMLEADAMATMQHATGGDQVPTEDQTTRHRKTERLDSLALLADLDKLNAHGSSDSTEDAAQ